MAMSALGMMPGAADGFDSTMQMSANADLIDLSPPTFWVLKMFDH
jgi:hypothetical protein